LTLNYESHYQTAVNEIKVYFDGDFSAHPYEIAQSLRPLFRTLIQEIGVKIEQLGDDLHEFAEALFFEICIGILEELDMCEFTMDLPLVSKYIACEAAVSYSMSGVVDALDEEFRTSRIGAAYLGAMLYLIMYKLEQKQIANSYLRGIC